MKRFLALVLLITLWATPARASIPFEDVEMVRGWHSLKGEAHPDDVAAIDRLLKINDAENGLLAKRGWQPGRPETWTIYLREFSSSGYLIPGQKRTAMCLPGVRWSNNRLAEVILRDCHLTGSLDVGGLSELKTLEVDNNNLTAIRGLESCVKLKELSAGGNQLTEVFSLDCALTAAIEPEDFREFKTLWLVNNSLITLRGFGRPERLSRLTFQELPGLFGPEVSRKLLATFRGLDSYARLAGPDHPNQLPGPSRREIDRHLLTVFKNPAASPRPVSSRFELYRPKAGFQPAGPELGLYRLEVNHDLLTGLSCLKNLKSLDLSRNRLASLGYLGRMPKLSRLNISHNLLPDLDDLPAIESLRDLSLEGNPFRDRAFLGGVYVNRLTAFSFSGEQLPEFSLWGLNLKSLRISGGTALKSVDLSWEELNSLILDDRVIADKLLNPGKIKNFRISGDFHYRLPELMALSDKLEAHFHSSLVGPVKRDDQYISKSRSAPAQTVTLGDAAAGLKAGRPYAPAELSPLLAEDFAAGGPEAAIHLFSAEKDRSQLERFHLVNWQSLKGAFQDGRLTFPAPGQYRLSITVWRPVRRVEEPKHSFTIHYDDVFIVE